MERRHYSIESLEGELRVFEDRYEISSEDAFRQHTAGGCPAGVSSFDLMVWIDAYCEAERLRAAPRPLPA